MKQNLINSLCISVIFFMPGCSFAETQNTNAGQITMNTNNMKTWCIGRYTYQLPTTATLVGGTDKFQSFLIKSDLNSSRDDFKKAYEEELKNYSSSSELIILDQPERKVDNRIIKLFMGRIGENPEIATDVFIWVLDGKTLFKITGTYSTEYATQAAEAYSYLADNITARDNNSLPKQEGICIINGLIEYSGQPFKHSINEHGFQFSNAPSVRVYTTAQSISRPTADLIKRTEKNLNDEGVLAKLSTTNKTIRKGAKSQTSGDKLSGVEWIVEDSMKGKNGIIATWEHMGIPKNTFDQQVRIQVDTADSRRNVQTSSMAEKEAIHFYETLLNTIKKF